jgi:hypothetical protein
MHRLFYLMGVQRILSVEPFMIEISFETSWLRVKFTLH